MVDSFLCLWRHRELQEIIWWSCGHRHLLRQHPYLSVVDKPIRVLGHGAPRGGAPRTLNNYLCLNWKFSGAFEFVALIFGHWDYKPLDAVLL